MREREKRPGSGILSNFFISFFAPGLLDDRVQDPEYLELGGILYK